MSLISDKDRYKKLSASDRARSRVQEDPNLPNKLIKVNQRNRQDSIDRRRSEEALDSRNRTKIYGTTPKANEVVNLFTLNEGESLVNVILCNKESTPICDIHWSYNKPEDLTFTNTGGMITGVTGGTTTRVLAKQWGARETETFSQTFASIVESREGHSVSTLSMFTNVPRNIYFYYVTSAATIDITYSIQGS
tara:strand:- start:1781 stop:2359 length:579 start_codon:yes stop_codon:yes gene_type:complete